jgi:hypothetical protein
LTRSRGYPRHSGATSIPFVKVDGQAGSWGYPTHAEGLLSLGSGRAAGESLAASARTLGAAACGATRAVPRFSCAALRVAAHAARATAHGTRAAARVTRPAGPPTFSRAAPRASGAAAGSLECGSCSCAPGCTGTATTGLFDGAAACATGAAARTAGPGGPEHGCGNQADHEEPGDETTAPMHHVLLHRLYMPIHMSLRQDLHTGPLIAPGTPSSIITGHIAHIDAIPMPLRTDRARPGSSPARSASGAAIGVTSVEPLTWPRTGRAALMVSH